MKTQKTTSTASARSTNPTTPAAKQIEIRKYECCKTKVVVTLGEKKDLSMCSDCRRAQRESNALAKRPLRVGLIAATEVAALQSVVRAANHARDAKLTAQALVLETRQGWEDRWGQHLAATADKLGSSMTNPVVRELAIETFAG